MDWIVQILSILFEPLLILMAALYRWLSPDDLPETFTIEDEPPIAEEPKPEILQEGFGLLSWTCLVSSCGCMIYMIFWT